LARSFSADFCARKAALRRIGAESDHFLWSGDAPVALSALMRAKMVRRFPEIDCSDGFEERS